MVGENDRDGARFLLGRRAEMSLVFLSYDRG